MRLGVSLAGSGEFIGLLVCSLIKIPSIRPANKAGCRVAEAFSEFCLFSQTGCRKAISAHLLPPPRLAAPPYRSDTPA